MLLSPFRLAIACALLLTFHSGLLAQGSLLPAGTAIPVLFSHTLDARKLHVGQTIEARTMQLVFAGPTAILPKGTRIYGTVVGASYSGKNQPSSLDLQFNRLSLHGTSERVCLAVRAVASLDQVYQARNPVTTMDANPSLGTTLVGGDHIQLGSDKVFTPGGKDQVGIQTHDGVFSRLEPPLPGSPSSSLACGGVSTLQSVAVFSSRACGLYGFPGIVAVQHGTTLSLSSDRDPVTIHSGSAALLQVAACNKQS
jgi:hypothetical protein